MSFSSSRAPARAARAWLEARTAASYLAMASRNVTTKSAGSPLAMNRASAFAATSTMAVARVARSFSAARWPTAPISLAMTGSMLAQLLASVTTGTMWTSMSVVRATFLAVVVPFPWVARNCTCMPASSSNVSSSATSSM